MDNDSDIEEYDDANDDNGAGNGDNDDKDDNGGTADNGGNDVRTLAYLTVPYLRELEGWMNACGGRWAGGALVRSQWPNQWERATTNTPNGLSLTAIVTPKVDGRILICRLISILHQCC